MRRRWGWMALVAVLSFVTGGWLVREKPAADGDVYQQARLFEDVLSAIRRHYVDSISESDLYFRATQGIVDHLRDPYATLLVGDAYRRFTDRLTGVEIGIGVQLDSRDGWITVIAPEPGSPAEFGGLAPGDQIVSIDGVSIKGWKIDRAAEALRGPEHSRVLLGVRKAGATRVSPVRLTRASIRVPSLASGFMVRDSIGYIRLSAINGNSADELETAIEQLRGEGMRGLVLDLRRNPGGLFEQGVKVADLLLDEAEPIGTIRGRHDNQVQEVVARSEQQWPGLPVAVLVDRGTASSAELIVGAWQDHDRALVVGTPTFGKAVIQSTFPIGKDIAVKLTTARWYTPSGRSIQRPLAFGDSTSDSTGASTEAFRSDTGRPLESGEGIVPDVLVAQPGPSADERALLRALGEDQARYREMLLGYAQTTELPADATPETVRITPRMRAELLRRVRADGIRIPLETWNDAREAVDSDLTYEIVRARFGDEAAQAHRLAADRQLQTALELLAAARTPDELLALAPAAPTTETATR